MYTVETGDILVHNKELYAKAKILSFILHFVFQPGYVQSHFAIKRQIATHSVEELPKSAESVEYLARNPQTKLHKLVSFTPRMNKCSSHGFNATRRCNAIVFLEFPMNVNRDRILKTPFKTPQIELL